jgi:hypothetical protein
VIYRYEPLRDYGGPVTYYENHGPYEAKGYAHLEPKWRLWIQVMRAQKNINKRPRTQAREDRRAGLWTAANKRNPGLLDTLTAISEEMRENVKKVFA